MSSAQKTTADRTQNPQQRVGIYRNGKLIDTIDISDNVQAFASTYNDLMQYSQYRAMPLDEPATPAVKGGVA